MRAGIVLDRVTRGHEVRDVGGTGRRGHYAERGSTGKR